MAGVRIPIHQKFENMVDKLNYINIIRIMLRRNSEEYILLTSFTCKQIQKEEGVIFRRTSE
jgi:hypothetical protein